ncbi:MAG: hypothetical protein A2Z77_06295 [Chloroflexi bacterium RBG_13_51_36]|nr:MAG: hypothetical protein A2Z77_06295 [Chloroflexi bacterium RBG_13_51_36]
MPSEVYTCNGCRKTLSFDGYPPVGDVSVGFTCPECSKHAKEIWEELDARLRQCGRDGEMTMDYYRHKLTPAQLSTKYGCTKEQALHSIGLCMGYITGEKRKAMSYDEWVKKLELEACPISTIRDIRHAGLIVSEGLPTDEHLMAIGKIVAASARLEETISDCFSLLLGCEPELGGILADSLPSRERCDTLFHIFAYRFGSAEMIRSRKDPNQDEKIQLLSDLFGKIDKAIKIRNRMIHSVWSSDTEDERKAHRFRWSRKDRKKPGFPSDDYSLLSVEEILKDVASIDEVRNELFLFLWDYFGEWILERAERGEGGLGLSQRNGESGPATPPAPPFNSCRAFRRAL